MFRQQRVQLNVFQLNKISSCYDNFGILQL